VLEDLKDKRNNTLIVLRKKNYYLDGSKASHFEFGVSVSGLDDEELHIKKTF